MTFAEGARPFDLPGSTDLGVLVIHGFTSTPGSVLDWAQGLNKLGGWTAVGPLLPGHGTVWQDLNKVRWQDWEATVENAYQKLAGRVKRVVVVGLSLGGALALQLASQHPEIAGLVLVNHLMILDSPLLPFAPIIRRFVASIPVIAGDLKKPNVTEPAYTVTPTGGVDEFRKMLNKLKRRLPDITIPTLMLKSKDDHVVPLKSATWTLERLGSPRKDLIWLEDSYHVATMDNDLGRIVDESVRFIRSL